MRVCNGGGTPHRQRPWQPATTTCHSRMSQQQATTASSVALQAGAWPQQVHCSSRPCKARPALRLLIQPAPAAASTAPATATAVKEATIAEPLPAAAALQQQQSRQQQHHHHGHTAASQRPLHHAIHGGYSGMRPRPTALTTAKPRTQAPIVPPPRVILAVSIAIRSVFRRMCVAGPAHPLSDPLWRDISPLPHAPRGCSQRLHNTYVWRRHFHCVKWHAAVVAV